MQWTPVEIDITSPLKKPFAGVISISAPQDELTEMTVIEPFVLTPKLPCPRRLAMKFAFAAQKCHVSILDDKGRSQWRGEYELWGGSGSSGRLTVIDEDEMLIGLAGPRRFGLMQLPDYAYCRRSDFDTGDIYVKDKLPRYLPWDWTGYASLDLLVLYNPDWQAVNPEQSKAIAEWVSNGGKLLVVLGERSLPAGGAIAGILPCEVGEKMQTTISARNFAEWDGNGAPKRTVDYWELNPKSGAKVFDKKEYGTGKSLFMAGFAGFGRVCVLAFDPSKLELRDPQLQAKFWVEHLKPLLGDGSGDTVQRGIELGKHEEDDYGGYSSSYFETGLEGRGANAVMEHLLDIPELRPISIWWVILILATLAILLGPVDYFVLKLLDRQPLTWITSAVCVVLFTLGARYGVIWLRAGPMKVRAVSVLDGVEGTSHAWNTTYSSVFAPQSDDYRFNGLLGNQWWSVISPSREEQYARSDKKVSLRRVSCTQHHGGNLPHSVPINVLSVQCFMNEARAQAMPISATVLKLADDTVTIRIENRSDRPISRGRVRFAENQEMRFGSVPAGESGEFSGDLNDSNGWEEGLDEGGGYGYGYGHVPSFANRRSSAYVARGSLQRTQAIYAYLRSGAAVVCAEYDDAAAPFGVENRKNEYSHVRLVRLVVFPKEGF